MHYAATALMQRVGTYWHMLPEAAQARKAIWDAVDPYTGLRRIDTAFPKQLREVTRENEMFIRFRNGSTWQVVGSDNFNSLVGSPPIGLVSSEHALSNPAAWAYLRPILRENGGWALFITTPRGKNHAHALVKAHLNDPEWFVEIKPATQTPVFDEADLAAERAAYHSEYGTDHGEALYQQEYLCSFEAAVLGAYYAGELADMRATGRIGSYPHVAGLPVYVGGDLGRTDSTALWFWQMVGGAPRFIDFHESNTKDVPFYVDLLKGESDDPTQLEANKRRRTYKYGDPPLWLPHDAKAETLASPRSVQKQFSEGGFRSRIVPSKDLQDGIVAARATMKVCTINEATCTDGLEALSAYRREWDTEDRVFKAKPMHNWASHPADGFRYSSIAWREDRKPEPDPEPRFALAADAAPSFNELRDMVRKRRMED